PGESDVAFRRPYRVRLAADQDPYRLLRARGPAVDEAELRVGRFQSRQVVAEEQEEVGAAAPLERLQQALELAVGTAQVVQEVAQFDLRVLRYPARQRDARPGLLPADRLGHAVGAM